MVYSNFEMQKNNTCYTSIKYHNLKLPISNEKIGRYGLILYLLEKKRKPQYCGFTNQEILEALQYQEYILLARGKEVMDELTRTPPKGNWMYFKQNSFS